MAPLSLRLICIKLSNRFRSYWEVKNSWGRQTDAPFPTRTGQLYKPCFLKKTFLAFILCRKLVKWASNEAWSHATRSQLQPTWNNTSPDPEAHFIQLRHLLCNPNYAKKLRHLGVKPGHLPSDSQRLEHSAHTSVCLSLPGALSVSASRRGRVSVTSPCRPLLSHSWEWQKGEFDLSVLETAWLSAFPFLSTLSQDAVTLQNYLESSVLEVFPMGCLWHTRGQTY